VVDGGGSGEEVWPALTEGEPWPWRKEPLEPARLRSLWRGEWEGEGPVAAVTATAAMALKTLGRARSVEEALGLARRLWAERDREACGSA
jgi:anthranilate phosphoribosyltransferase